MKKRNLTFSAAIILGIERAVQLEGAEARAGFHRARCKLIPDAFEHRQLNQLGLAASSFSKEWVNEYLVL